MTKKAGTDSRIYESEARICGSGSATLATGTTAVANVPRFLIVAGVRTVCLSICFNALLLQGTQVRTVLNQVRYHARTLTITQSLYIFKKSEMN
jgi:hypothetical protein